MKLRSELRTQDRTKTAPDDARRPRIVKTILAGLFVFGMALLFAICEIIGWVPGIPGRVAIVVICFALILGFLGVIDNDI